MKKLMKCPAWTVLLLLLGLFQLAPVQARSDDVIQREIAAQIAGAEKLRGTRIQIHVQQRLVVLSGEVRRYQQKLISGRIAWTTPGVYEVDNEIQVVPQLPMSDAAIEDKIREIINGDERFHEAHIVVSVNKGKVFLSGGFLDFGDPSILKHRVAEIEGVLAIEIKAAFLAQSSGIKPQARANP